MVGQRVTVKIDKLVGGGDGLARQDDGRVVFVPGVLPGERVVAEVVSAKKDFAKTRLVEVLDASADRRRAPCPYVAAGCGGCDWQHIAPAAQLRLKAQIVEEALRRTARLATPSVGIGAAVDEAGYRTTLRMAADDHGRLGFRGRQSHRVVVVDRCMVAAEGVNRALAAIDQIARGTDEVTIRAGLSSGDVSVTPGAPGTITERVAGVDLRVSPGSFFQSGPQAAHLLVDAVRQAAGDLVGTAMIDAYGGIGLFAATVGGPGSLIVESNAAATADAHVNVAGRSIAVATTTVEEWKVDRTDRRWMVADPARAGLGRDGVAAVVRSEVHHLVLVSCDPVAMARDTALLVDAGFVHRHSTVLDLFPNTHHVEVVTRFDRAVADRPAS
ncbi:MAG TPA: TRAM domain-containing protein [Ilumatobacteraceae bacterium]|nr:TRAM domain-containing protein [Ilumatobacteraceae bacterium]